MKYEVGSIRYEVGSRKSELGSLKYDEETESQPELDSGSGQLK